MTYIVVLTMVVIIGISIGAANQEWKTIVKREREKELVFRGMQYKEAIENWYNKDYPPGKGHNPQPLRELKDLLTSPDSLQKIHYIRKLYTDPITGKEFVAIKGSELAGLIQQPPSVMKPGQIQSTATNAPLPALPPAAMGGIVGVRSSSDVEPIRTYFDDIPALKDLFKDKKKYSEWLFMYDKVNASVAEHAKTYKAYREPGN
jgi:type II secretory pathway pseudopilin PulG